MSKKNISKNIDKNINKNKKNKKKKSGDTLTVFFIFAIIIIAAIGVSIFQVTRPANKMFGNGSKHSQKEMSQNETVILAVGGISVCIVAVFVASKIKNRRKKRRLLEEKRRKQQEIEAARLRVEASKYNDILAAGRSVMKERADTRRILESQNTGRVRHKYDLNNIDELDDDLSNNYRGINKDNEEERKENKRFIGRLFGLFRKKKDDNLENDDEYNDDYNGDFVEELEADKKSILRDNKIIVLGGVAVISVCVMIVIMLMS